MMFPSHDQVVHPKPYNKNRYYFLTINPVEISVSKFMQIIQKVMKKKWITSYKYTIEFRDPNGRGIHMHSIIEHNNKRIYNAKKEIYNTVKSIVGNVKHVNLQRIKSQTEYDNVTNYITKNKPQDIILRQKYNIRQLYIGGGITS